MMDERVARENLLREGYRIVDDPRISDVRVNHVLFLHCRHTVMLRGHTVAWRGQKGRTA
jgi:hypothetical protein